VEVDYTQEDLKIQGNIRDEILSSVEIVFHVMASVRFDEPLKDAVDINMLATKKMLALAEKMTNLKSYLHVSTLYSNSNRLEDDVVDEIIYDHRLSYEQLIYISKISEQNPALVAKLFQNSDPRDNFPNTYTLTKHFAEKIVASYSSYLPCGIFRPPIVFSSYDDHRGYLQNFNGPSAFSAMLDKGFFRVICCDGWKKTNIIPVDYCMNASIVMAWDVHQKFIEKKRQIPIYNYTFKRNNMTWREMIDISFSNEKLLKRFTS
jgi:alcohol-forming fatty acyl-CoA reductase